MGVTLPDSRARSARPRRRHRRKGVGGVILFALVALALFIGVAFATGYLIGKLLI